MILNVEIYSGIFSNTHIYIYDFEPLMQKQASGEHQLKLDCPGTLFTKIKNIFFDSSYLHQYALCCSNFE
jgi:hypothetical protein